MVRAIMDELHHIRFKRGDAEFELAGSAAQVNAVWSALETSVTDAFKNATSQPSRKQKKNDEGSDSDTPPTRQKASPRKRSTQAGAGRNGGRTEIKAALAEVKLDDFPELGDSPPSLYVGCAVLRFARDVLGHDGLLASEIREFAADRLRESVTAQAYRQAFNSNKAKRAVDRSGSPTVFRLMKAGDAALDAYLAKIQAGGSAAEAEAAATEAEEQAEKSE